jgi:hypothetical protein
MSRLLNWLIAQRIAVGSPAQNKAKEICEDSHEKARFAELIDCSRIMGIGSSRRTKPSESAKSLMIVPFVRG